MSAAVTSAKRIAIMAEMHGRDLTRRHAALVLLMALPLSFYFASLDTVQGALVAGGIGMSFSVSGAALFSIISSREVDQRIVLSGYRPHELLIGRLLFLGALGLAMATAFATLMIVVSHPAQPWMLVAGVTVVALQSVPFGLAVGALVPRELEGTLVLIGVVGMQLAVDADAAVAKVLPFYGARQLIEAGAGSPVSVWPALAHTLLYAVALLLVARLLLGRRIEVVRHPITSRQG